MKYGYFDDANYEYVITTPYTPLPWINYLGSEDFFSLISHTAGGYSFYKDAKLRRITRYRYNNVPADNGARSYYITKIASDGTPELTWSPTFVPALTPLDSYECRHGMGYSTFSATKNGISSKLTAFVPLHTHAEINQLTLTNATDQTVTLDVTGAMEWCLWNAVDDANNFQRNFSTGEVEVEIGDDVSTLYHKTEYKERRNHYAFYAVNAHDSGFDTSRNDFIGAFRSWNNPQVIEEGAARNSVAHGWSPIAAHRVRLTLEPNATQSLIFILGYVELDPEHKWQDPTDPAMAGIINKQPAHELIECFTTNEQVEAAFNELRTYWRNLLSTFTVSSDDSRLDRMVNIWNQYQCMVTFNMSRSASYYEAGTGRGMGFRDSNQDILGFVHLIPDRARARILDIAATQLPDGSAWHQYQPLTKQGNADIGGGFNDDPLWLVASTYAYLCETGDSTILNEPTQFDNKPESQQPLLEHLRRSVQYTITHKGPHGLPLIGRADWNDCLNLNCFSTDPSESFQTVENNDTGVAESIFIGGMFVLYAGQYVSILERYGTQCGMSEDEVARETASVREEIAAMNTALTTSGWDGEWFLRAYDAYSRPVGSHTDTEGRIYIEPQGMCVMAGVGLDDGKAQQALASVKRELTSEWGTAILAPAYSTYRVELGEISSYPRGYKENGGVFCHNNPWISIANAVAGNNEEAFAVWQRTCPAYVEDKSDIRKTEPYVYCQMVAGPEAATPGEGKNSWLTGTAAWTFVNVSQYLLGVQPEFDSLKIEPHLPELFSHVTVTRVWRGVTYHIDMQRTGTYSLNAQEAAVNGSCVALPANGNTVHVSVTW